MKHYNTKFIKEYINEHKDEIEFVECGMREDWSWTRDVIYEDDFFSSEFDWDSETIEIAGISGSTWATPVMRVWFKDGHEEVVECYTDDNRKATRDQIEFSKLYAFITGGMDSI